MAFKDLFIISDEKKSEQKKETPKFTSKFSETPLNFPSTKSEVKEATPTVHIPLECAPHMDNIMSLYEKGFVGLNKPGIEFFEFFQAVVEAGADNPSAYKMALKMLSTMEKTMTKDSLVSQSQFYIDELTKVHSGYNTTGNQKKGELMNEKSSEEQQLKNDVQLLKQQLESIKNQISNKELQLSQIDSKYQPKINELDCKLMANEEAKNRILGTILKVVNGIKNNL